MLSCISTLNFLARIASAYSSGLAMIPHADRNRGGGRGVARCVAGDGSQRVHAVGGACGVPANGIPGSSDFGAEVRTIEFELHSGDTDVIGRAADHGDPARVSCSSDMR